MINMTQIDDKIFFKPGDLVQIKQDLPNKPIMLVYKIERNIIKNTEGNELLKGIKVRWFTKDGYLQEAVFSTKDLQLLEN